MLKKNFNMKPSFKHNKIGMFMFNLCAKWTKFIIKHRWLYYLLACTWGGLLTLTGWLITGVLAILKLFKVNINFKKYYWIYNISVGPAFWGGCEFGLMFLRDHKSLDSAINAHEFGHSIQNTLLGPLYIFIVMIPSAIRYWIRTLKPKSVYTAYDDIWFEDSATQCGKYAIKYINQKKNLKK